MVRQLAWQAWESRRRFAVTLLPVDEAIRWTLAAEGGPFILSPLDQGRGGDVSGQPLADADGLRYPPMAMSSQPSGVTRACSPARSRTVVVVASTATRSVKVPPTSIPTGNRSATRPDGDRGGPPHPPGAARALSRRRASSRSRSRGRTRGPPRTARAGARSLRLRPIRRGTRRRAARRPRPPWSSGSGRAAPSTGAGSGAGVRPSRRGSRRAGSGRRHLRCWLSRALRSRRGGRGPRRPRRRTGRPRPSPAGTHGS